MQRHAGIALMALGQPATVVARQAGGKAAPVDEDQRLLASFQRLADGLQRPGQKASPATLMAHVQEFQLGGRVAAGALGQAQVPIDARERLLKAFQRRGGATQQQWDLVVVCPGHGEIPGVVTKPVMLLVRAVVLLVDDDRTRLGQRCENGRAGADDDHGAPAGGGFPDVQCAPGR